MRTSLHEALTKADAPGEWTHVLKQIGMFSYTGLTPKQVPCYRASSVVELYCVSSPGLLDRTLD